jgi:hypothetical protein
MTNKERLHQIQDLRSKAIGAMLELRKGLEAAYSSRAYNDSAYDAYLEAVGMVLAAEVIVKELRHPIKNTRDHFEDMGVLDENEEHDPR